MAYSTLARLSAEERKAKNQAKAAHMRECRMKKRVQESEVPTGSAFAKLPPQHKMFVLKYIEMGFNAKGAAIAAGYEPRFAHSTSYNLKNAKNIAAAIQERLRHHQLSADEVLTRVSEMATANPLSYIDATGKVDFEALKKVGYLVKEFDAPENGKRARIRLHDQAAMLLAMGKHHNLFIDRQEVTGTGGGAIQHEVLTLTADQAAAAAPKPKKEEKQ